MSRVTSFVAVLALIAGLLPSLAAADRVTVKGTVLEGSVKSLDAKQIVFETIYGKGDLKTEFSPELDTTGKCGAKGDLVLKLTPKKPSAQYKNLYLVVNPSDFRVTQSIIIDSSNNTNHFRFFAPDFEKAIDAKWFDFNEKSVKNYRIVDADSQGSGAAPAKKP